jgi:hypothetical protein
MANVKFTDLNPNDRAPTLAGTDILAVTTDPSGSPVSKATTITNLMGQAPVQSVNTATGAVVLDADDIDDSSTTNKFVTQSDITKLDSALQSTDSINALSDVDTSTTTPSDGQALVWDNANSKWEPGTVSGGGNVEGTAVLSTGETEGVKFLREDGDNTCSWQEVVVSYGIQTYTASGTPLAFTLTSAAKGKVVVVNEASIVYVTVPTGLGAGFNCTFVQLGVGQIVVQAGSGAVVGAYTPGTAAFNTTAGQNAALHLVPTATDNYVVFGETGAAPFANTYSLSFDGTNDWISTNGLSSLNSVSTFSMSWWYKSSVAGNRMFWSGGASDRCQLKTTGIEVRIGGTAHTFGTANYADGNWRQLTLTYNSGTAKMYIDGSSTPIGTTTSFPTSTTSSAFTSFRIGNVASLYWYNGLIDEFAVWSSELSGTEVADLQASSEPIDVSSDSGNYTSSSNLIHYWRMGDNDSGTGTTITDIAGTVDGTISGATFDTDVP